MFGACMVVVAFLLVSVGLTIVEARRITPLAYRCQRCETDFTRPPHHDFPRECPSCRARDWAS